MTNEMMQKEAVSNAIQLQALLAHKGFTTSEAGAIEAIGLLMAQEETMVTPKEALDSIMLLTKFEFKDMAEWEVKLLIAAGVARKKEQPFVNRGKELGRNDKCICGSGKKHKSCCLDKVQFLERSRYLDGKNFK